MTLYLLTGLRNMVSASVS